MSKISLFSGEIALHQAPQYFACEKMRDLPQFSGPLDGTKIHVNVTQAALVMAGFRDPALPGFTILDFLEDPGTGQCSYTSEQAVTDDQGNPNGDYVIITYDANGRLRGSLYNRDRSSASQLPSFSADTGEKPAISDLPMDGLFGLLLARGMRNDAEVRDLMQKLREACAAGTLDDYLVSGDLDILYGLSERLETLVTGKVLPTIFSGTRLSPIPADEIESSRLNGTPLPDLPAPVCVGRKWEEAPEGPRRYARTMREARSYFADWRRDHSDWPEELQALIPTLDDDFPIPRSAEDLATIYVRSVKEDIPMVNLMMRGKPGVGKSFCAQCVAAMLNMPFVRLTCSPSMDRTELVSAYVPNTDPATSAALPFTHDQSELMKAMIGGYICEVQEISRVRDPGLLVSLNEYDHPHARIKLADGSFAERHPEALVIYTDNVGLASCRKTDESVTGRISVIMDLDDLPEEDVINRVMYNSKLDDISVVKTMYDIWRQIDEFCKDRDITENAVTIREIEAWAKAVKLMGKTRMGEFCVSCVINKATADREEQNEIKNILRTCGMIT